MDPTVFIATLRRITARAGGFDTSKGSCLGGLTSADFHVSLSGLGVNLAQGLSGARKCRQTVSI